MTDETTRIPVPTNGHARLPAEEGTTGPTTSRVARDRRPVPPGVAAGTDLRRAVALDVRPLQLATGFAVLAGLIGLVLGLRRRRGR